jgi:Fic family protein
VRIADFTSSSAGVLRPITGDSTQYGRWKHVAFVPEALPAQTPDLTVATFNAVASARAALAALDSSARQLPNPALLRRPTLRREAQSTSALEGTYAPLQAVLAADEDEEPSDDAMREVLNYVRMAEHAFAWHADGRPLALNLLTELHATLVRGSAVDGDQAGRVRTIQVVIGGHPGGRVQDSRFVPQPPGLELEQQVRNWLTWISDSSHEGQIDPVVAAGMGHYLFETLHPFNDGNGRIGRLLIVLQLLYAGILAEPTLTVSPWFEDRRADYYDALMGVSTRGDWDTWIRFFADGLAASARDTERRLLDLLKVQGRLKAQIRDAGLRANNAILLVDFALAQPIFTVRQVQRSLSVTYTRANTLVGQLVDLGVLRQFDTAVYAREFAAPDIVAVLLRSQ